MYIVQMCVSNELSKPRVVSWCLLGSGNHFRSHQQNQSGKQVSHVLFKYVTPRDRHYIDGWLWKHRIINILTINYLHQNYSQITLRPKTNYILQVASALSISNCFPGILFEKGVMIASYIALYNNTVNMTFNMTSFVGWIEEYITSWFGGWYDLQIPDVMLAGQAASCVRWASACYACLNLSCSLIIPQPSSRN